MPDLRVVKPGETTGEPPRPRSMRKRNPGKLNAQVQNTIVGYIRAGNYFNVACRAAGVSVSAATDWIMTGETGGPLKPRPLYRKFAEAVREAEAAAEAHAVLVVRKAINDGDARAAIEYLKRRHPERWGDKGQIQHAGGLTVVHRASPAELSAFSGEGEVLDAEAYEELEAPTLTKGHLERQLAEHPRQDHDIVVDALQDDAPSDAGRGDEPQVQ